MFAFALLDLRKHFATVPLVFLARDPLGIKPLYYSQTDEGFAFASELRALLASGLRFRASSLPTRSLVICCSAAFPSRLALVENVFSLPPGHRLLLHVPDRRRTPRARPWWDPRRSPAARDPRRPRNFTTAVPRVRALLEDSVRAHLIADVPVGLFLSSGLDSSAIAAFASSRAKRYQELHALFSGYDV